MSWLEAVPGGMALVAAFFTPGLIVLLAARLDWRMAVALAPAASVAVATAGAVVGQLAHVPWGWGLLAASTAVWGAGAWIFGWLVRPGTLDVSRGRSWIWALAGVVVAAPIAIVPLAAGMGSPEAPALTWDAVFHLNALQYIHDTGNASTLALSVVAGKAGYYPAGWHDLISLAIGAHPVSLYANAGSLIIAGIIWPLGLAFLAGVIFPARPVAMLLAPILGSGFAAFPARMLTYGTLWPNALSTALLPSVIAVLIVLLARGVANRQRLLLLVVFLFVLAGACLAHPTAAFAVAALAAPYVLWRAGAVLVRWWRSGRRLRAVLVPGIVVAVGVLGAVILVHMPRFRSVLEYPRGPASTHAQAVGEALLDSMLGSSGFGTPTAFWLMGAATVAGFVLLFATRGSRWVPFSYLVSVGLFTLAMGPDSLLRGLTGPWYKDPVRLGGLVPIFGTILAVYALVRLGEYVALQWQQHHFLGRRASGILRVGTASVAVIVILAVFLAATGMLKPARRQAESNRDYSAPLHTASGLLTSAELTMVEHLGTVVPKNQLILGNPFNGSAYAYSLADIPVVFPHVTGSWDADQLYLAKHFDQIGQDPKVCRLLDALHVGYFYEDPNLYFAGNAWQQVYSGLTSQGISSGLSAVDHAGNATVYKITACSKN